MNKFLIYGKNDFFANNVSSKLNITNYKFLNSTSGISNTIEKGFDSLFKGSHLIVDELKSNLPFLKLLKSQYNIKISAFDGESLISFDDALERLKKRIFLITMPKSGSVFLNKRLEQCLLTTADEIVGSTWAEFPGQQLSIPGLYNFLEHSTLCKSHLAPTHFNATLLNEATKIKKVKFILHLRDPRQALVSWIKFQGKINPLLKASLDKTNSVFKCSGFDFFYQSFYLKMVSFIEDWLQLVKTYGLGKDFIISTHEELSNSPKTLNKKIAFHIGVNETDLNIPQKPPEGKLHFRSGKIDEWKSFFNDSEISKLNKSIQNSTRDSLCWD